MVRVLFSAGKNAATAHDVYVENFDRGQSRRRLNLPRETIFVMQKIDPIPIH